MKENDPRRKYLQRSPEEMVHLQRLSDISAQILNILAKHKCSVEEIDRIMFRVNNKVKESSILQEKDYFK